MIPKQDLSLEVRARDTVGRMCNRLTTGREHPGGDLTPSVSPPASTQGDAHTLWDTRHRAFAPPCLPHPAPHRSPRTAAPMLSSSAAAPTGSPVLAFPYQPSPPPPKSAPQAKRLLTHFLPGHQNPAPSPPASSVQSPSDPAPIPQPKAGSLPSKPSEKPIFLHKG